MSYFSQLRDIIGDKKTAQVVNALGGRNIRIRTKLGHIKLEYVKGLKRFEKLTDKAVARKLGCSWRYARKLRSTLGTTCLKKVS